MSPFTLLRCLGCAEAARLSSEQPRRTKISQKFLWVVAWSVGCWISPRFCYHSSHAGCVFQYGFLIHSVCWCIPALNFNISLQNQKIIMSCSCSLCHNKVGNIAFMFNLQVQPSRILQLPFRRPAISPLTLTLTFLWIFFFPLCGSSSVA